MDVGEEPSGSNGGPGEVVRPSVVVAPLSVRGAGKEVRTRRRGCRCLVARSSRRSEEGEVGKCAFGGGLGKILCVPVWLRVRRSCTKTRMRACTQERVDDMCVRARSNVHKMAPVRSCTRRLYELLLRPMLSAGALTVDEGYPRCLVAAAAAAGTLLLLWLPSVASAVW